MTKTRLGVLSCPVAAHMGAGAEFTYGPAFGSGVGAGWFEQRQSGRVAAAAVRTVELIPPYTADNTISVSAPPERSP